MKDLIEALTILLKYINGDEHSPINCTHDEMHICCDIELEDVSKEDIKSLDELGFFWDDEFEHFMSFRFGSC